MGRGDGEDRGVQVAGELHARCAPLGPATA
jgi:hypothetical protein